MRSDASSIPAATDATAAPEAAEAAADAHATASAGLSVLLAAVVASFAAAMEASMLRPGSKGACASHLCMRSFLGLLPHGARPPALSYDVHYVVLVVSGHAPCAHAEVVTIAVAFSGCSVNAHDALEVTLTNMSSLIHMQLLVSYHPHDSE